MKNKVVKKLMMIVMAVTMLSGFSFATVYANADPPAEETTTEWNGRNQQRFHYPGTRNDIHFSEPPSYPSGRTLLLVSGRL